MTQDTKHTPGERYEFTMTEAQKERLLASMKSVPYMLSTGGRGPRSVQENANDAWRVLGDELGFVWDSVEPVASHGQLKFTALALATGKTL